jgi:predicted nucleic acid-binding protein
MGFLIDTNVLSELRKHARANANVLRWAAQYRHDELFLSTMVLGEIRRGIEVVRARDAAQAASLDDWHDRVVAAFGPRILPVTLEIAEIWGRLSFPNRLPEIDGILAATAVHHGHVIVTRNARDFTHPLVRALNPFADPPTQP